MYRSSARSAALAFLLACVCAAPAAAHGVVGARFFPATISTDDPFAADELALPTISVLRYRDGGASITESVYSGEYAKSILPGFAISLEDAIIHRSAAGGLDATGFDNLAVTPTVEFARSEAHEFIASASLTWEIGGTGSIRIGAERASALTPAIHFGKGFGDLPGSMALLRPFAVTAGIGYAIPGRGGDPRVLEWGGALEYSLSYLQANVRDVGLGPIAAHLTPVVEFALSSPLGHNGGKTVGTLNPGLIWTGRQIQFGAETIIPVNGETGSNLGFIAQLHFYIDDIFPHSLGMPLFGSFL